MVVSYLPLSLRPALQKSTHHTALYIQKFTNCTGKISTVLRREIERKRWEKVWKWKWKALIFAARFERSSLRNIATKTEKKKLWKKKKKIRKQYSKNTSFATPIETIGTRRKKERKRERKYEVDNKKVRRDKEVKKP